MVATTTRAIIGGTGTEAWTEATLLETRTIVTRYGRASAPAQHLSVAGERCWMLSRHGAGHDVAPHRINYRANIQALADLGVEEIVALNAVGIIDTEVQCGGLVMPEQLIDYTWGRHSTFADGVSAPLQHIAFDPPYTPGLRAALISAASAAGMPVIATGVMGVTQGPRLETAAEVDRLAGDGVTIIGMTGMPEAALACELGIAYASIGLVVNHAAGRGGALEDIHAQLAANMQSARHAALLVVAAWLKKA